MALLYPGKWINQSGEIDEKSPVYLDWFKVTEPLADEQFLQGFAECERKIKADDRAGKEAWPPSAIIFELWARHGNKHSGSGGVAHIGFNDPKHPRFDENSSQYEGLPHPDSDIARLANPNAGKGSPGSKREAGRSAISDMLGGLDKSIKNDKDAEKQREINRLAKLKAIRLGD